MTKKGHGPISNHISYTEAIRTSKKMKNEPNEFNLENMKLIAEKIFEPARKALDTPIRILSFFRCPEVNEAVGGSNTSQHMCGTHSGVKEAAIDLQVMDPNSSNANLFLWIKHNLEFDQLIWEFGTSKEPQWVHVSYREGSNRKRCLRAIKKHGKTVYEVMK